MTRARNVSNPQAIDIPLTVSANLTANAVITVGNSSVNSVISSNTYSIGSNVSLNTSRLFLGNSTVNSVHTASTLDVGANVNLSTVGLNVGSNTVNAYITSTSFAIGNSTVNTAITSTTITSTALLSIGNTNVTGTANVSAGINVGANVNLSTSQINVGNSTVNTTITSTALTTTSNTVSIGTAAYVVANGNLGIGTSSPTQKLDVAGQVTISSGNGYLWGNGAVQIYSNSSYLRFRTASTDRLEIDSSGNLGLGVTPSAWNSTYKAFQIGGVGRSLAQTGAGAGDWTLAFNAIYSSANSRWDYAYTGDAAVRYSQTGAGIHAWYTAASGTAGNAITFTQAMTLDASGNLGLGTTSPNQGGGTRAITLDAPVAGNYSGFELMTGGTLRAKFIGNSSQTYLGTSTATPLVLITADTERMRIDSSGNVMVGTTTTISSSGRTTLSVFTSDASTGGQIVVGYNSSTRSAQMLGDSAAAYFGSIANIPVIFRANQSEVFRITSAGYVGINTSNPGTNGAFEIRKAVTTSAMTNCSFSTSDAASSTFDIGHPAANIVALSAQGSTIAFYGGGVIGNAERMRLDRTTGQLLINDTTDAAGGGGRLHITGNGSQTAASIKIGTNGYPGWYFVNSSGTKVGDIVINSASTTYNTISDYRLKENVAPMTGALAKVAQLKPVTYKWKVDGSSSQGFIAHELQAVVPDCVTGTKDALKEDGNPEYQGVDTSFLVATLTAAIQEQQALITQLQADVAELKSR